MGGFEDEDEDEHEHEHEHEDEHEDEDEGRRTSIGTTKKEGGMNPMNEEPLFDHEKLDVYRVELAFLAWVTTLLEGVKSSSSGQSGEIRDQLDRASLSALLNTAEGNGKRQGRQRAKAFDDARGSAVECAACLDALVAKGLAAPLRIVEGKQLLLRVVAMLCKMIRRFDPDA
jgi:four helix bundle protein